MYVFTFDEKKTNEMVERNCLWISYDYDIHTVTAQTKTFFLHCLPHKHGKYEILNKTCFENFETIVKKKKKENLEKTDDISFILQQTLAYW